MPMLKQPRVNADLCSSSDFFDESCLGARRQPASLVEPWRLEKPGPEPFRRYQSARKPLKRKTLRDRLAIAPGAGAGLARSLLSPFLAQAGRPLNANPIQEDQSMKRPILIITALAVLLPLTVTADQNQNQNQNQNQDQNQDQNQGTDQDRNRNRCSLAAFLPDLPWQELDEGEVFDLAFMREEEKLARDVYLSFFEDYESKIFRQIARAERTHMRAVLFHLRKYELADPAAGNPVGVFSNPELQELYYWLVNAGSDGIGSALWVGARIEEIDISDLYAALERTDNVDLATLYQNLLKGSRNHLRAFDKKLTRLGIEYVPEYLSQEEYDAIVTSPKEKGVVDADGEYLCGGRGNRLGAG